MADKTAHLGQNLGNFLWSGRGGGDAAMDFLRMMERGASKLVRPRDGLAQARERGAFAVVCPRPVLLPASSSWPHGARAKTALKR